MSKSFLFVDGASTDQREKRAARRHVMIGKNAGKQFHRRSRFPQPSPSSSRQHQHCRSFERDAFEVEQNGSSLAHEAVTISQSRSLLAVKNLNAVFPTIHCPVNVSPAAQWIIYEYFQLTSERLYPVKINVCLHEAKRNWLEVLFTDEASYRCNLALMQACNEIFLRNGADSSQALYHLSNTFSQVRSRLSSPDALSNGSIAIVMSLVIQEQIRSEKDQASLHFRGLQRMVELRGGLEDLEANTELVLKACKIDICLSLESGRRPIYFRDRMTEVWEPPISDADTCERNSLRLHHGHPFQDDCLESIRIDMMRFCSHLNEPQRPATRQLDLRCFYETNVSLFYRLLRARSLDEILQSEVDDYAVQHLGMLLFMMTVFLDNDHRQIVNFACVRRCIRHVASNMPAELNVITTVWFCLLGLIWTANSSNDGSLVESLQCAASRLETKAWLDARAAMSALPWLNDLHDGNAYEIWSRIILIDSNQPTTRV